jgi:hypothetical protein
MTLAQFQHDTNDLRLTIQELIQVFRAQYPMMTIDISVENHRMIDAMGDSEITQIVSVEAKYCESFRIY